MKRIFSLVIIFSLVSLTWLCVFADEPTEVQAPYKITLENNTTFYMTPPWKEFTAYPKSGLYTNTNPSKLIYYAEPSDIVEDSYGCIPESELNLSKDGMFYAVLPYWVAGSENDAAIGFYKKGKLMKSYKVSTLMLDKNKMEETASHYFWVKNRSFDKENNLLTVYTLENNTIIFDITTGAIVKGYPKNGWQTIEGSEYYFGKDGGMLTKSKNIGGIRYKFANDGVSQGKYTGWVKDSNGSEHYYNDGIMQVK